MAILLNNIEAGFCLIESSSKNKMDQETIERFNPAQEFPVINYGLPYPEALARQLSTTLQCSRPFIIISKSLTQKTDALQRLNAGLDNGAVKVAGIHMGMRSHTYYSEVLDVAGKVKAAGADSVVTIGGGSLTDAAKAIVLVSSLHCNEIGL